MLWTKVYELTKNQIAAGCAIAVGVGVVASPLVKKVMNKAANVIAHTIGTMTEPKTESQDENIS